MTARKAWEGMLDRCRRTANPKYPRYGGRGIRVRYDSYDAFLADVGPRPGPGYSVGRLDNDGDYAPGNCRWETQLQQQANRSTNRRLAYWGYEATLSEWARWAGLKRTTLRMRLDRYGFSVEEAIEGRVKT